MEVDQPDGGVGEGDQNAPGNDDTQPGKIMQICMIMIILKKLKFFYRFIEISFKEIGATRTGR
jgi:hypothetical protein